jgi:hypothetical protein
VTLYTPNTKCIIVPCELEFEVCELRVHLMSDRMKCHRAKVDGKPLPNGMCRAKGGGAALRVRL